MVVKSSILCKIYQKIIDNQIQSKIFNLCYIKDNNFEIVSESVTKITDAYYQDHKNNKIEDTLICHPTAHRVIFYIFSF